MAGDGQISKGESVLEILKRQEALLERIVQLYESQNNRLGDLLGVLGGHIKSTDEIAKGHEEISKGHIKSTDEIAKIVKQHGESIEKLRLDINAMAKNFIHITTGKLSWED